MAFSSLTRHSRFSALLPLTVGAASIAVVFGCQPAPASRIAPTTAPASSRTVEFDAHDFAFTAPETLPAGLTTIRLTNHGSEVHHGQLLRLNDTVSFDDLMADFQKEGDAALRLVSGEGGPGATDPEGVSEVTLDLKPGTYALACFIAGADGVPHMAKGMLKPIQVTATGATTAEAPKAEAKFTIKDFSIDIPASLPTGRHTFQVTNTGPQMHEMNVVKLAPGKTVDDELAWEKSPSGPPPFQSAGGINAFSASNGGFMTLDLTPGTYVALCRVPDPASGIGHLHLGMYRVFTVEG